MNLPPEFFPPGVHWRVMAPDDADPASLPAGEYSQIAAAVPVRQREYAAVRQLARDILCELGVTPCEFPNGPDRAPRFPPGIAGSFSHTRSLALAVLAPVGDIAAIGCDLEPRLPLPCGVRERVLGADERAALDGRPPWWDRLMFSAKEAVYKAQYPLSGTFLDFDAVSVRVDCAQPRFTATLLVGAGPLAAGRRFEGRYCVTGELIATLVVVEAG